MTISRFIPARPGIGTVLPALILFAGALHAQVPAPLTLDRTVAMYVERNLELQAARYQLERSKADEIAARLRPNPIVAATAENFAFSGPLNFNRIYEVGFIYTDTIELGGKRALRE